MKNFIKIIKAYKLMFIKIILYELYYILLGYKGNSYNFRNNEKKTDNIPCPYFFLSKISKFIKKKEINSLTDLGCGSGRSIYFLNRKYPIKYYGIEYFKETFFKCKLLFQSNPNIKIINNDFMDFNFLKFNSDCYFINDPLKNLNDFEILINKIIDNYINVKKLIFFIFINIEEEKVKKLNNLYKIESLMINKRGYFIYSNKNV
jgi:SAM-dependent methyltransferase